MLPQITESLVFLLCPTINGNQSEGEFSSTYFCIILLLLLLFSIALCLHPSNLIQCTLSLKLALLTALFIMTYIFSTRVETVNVEYAEPLARSEHAYFKTLYIIFVSQYWSSSAVYSTWGDFFCQDISCIENHSGCYLHISLSFDYHLL